MKLATAAYTYEYFHPDLPLPHVRVDTGPRTAGDLAGIWARAVGFADRCGPLADRARDVCRIMVFRGGLHRE